MPSNPNEAALLAMTHELGELADELVFVGGAIVGLLVDDTAAAPIRVTRDIDALLQVASTAAYYQMAERLRARGVVGPLWAYFAMMQRLGGLGAT